MRKPKPTPAELFWMGLAAYILIADAALMRKKHDTMSICFGHWTETSHGKLFCATATGALVSHLFWKTPLPLQSKFKLLVARDKIINLEIIDEEGFEECT